MNPHQEDAHHDLPTTIGVTGAAGFIGANLVERLLDEGCIVVGCDDLSMGTLRNLDGLLGHPRFRFEEFDCRDARRMRAAMGGCDAIAHLAALKIPRYGGAMKTLEVNVDGSHVALELGRCDRRARACSPRPRTSTARPCRRSRRTTRSCSGPPTCRRWSYAASKYYDEHLALRMAEEQDLKVTILRFFNAYGPRNHPSWWGGPLSVFFEDLLDGREMDLHGDGRQTRSFTYVSDTVDGVVRALARPEAAGEVINIGNDQPIAIVDLARKVQDAMGIEGPLRARTVPLESLGGNYQDVRHRVPDLTKARRLLGFEPAVPLEEGLARTLAWHLALRRRSRWHERGPGHRCVPAGGEALRPRLTAVERSDAALMSVGTLASGVLAYLFNVLAARALGPGGLRRDRRAVGRHVPARGAAVPAARADRLAGGGAPHRPRRGRPPGGALRRAPDRRW